MRTVIALDAEINLSAWKADMEYLSRYPNVYCKLTATSGKFATSTDPESAEDRGWSPAAVVTQAIAAFGPDRCLFGSGWPVCRLVEPAATGWCDSGTGGTLASASPYVAKVPRKKLGGPVKGDRGAVVRRSQLSVWEAARLVEHCMEDAGFGAIEDKRKVFGNNAQAVYTLNIRPYGSSRVI